MTTTTGHVTEAEAVALDRWMDDHMYGHQINNSYAGMACDVDCRTDALRRGVQKMLDARAADPSPGVTP